MNVILISYTKQINEPEYCKTLADSIAYCARVSNKENQLNTETNERLLSYMIRHKHWSPFEMVSVKLEIDTTRDISHQIVRHRSFVFQEFSQRYASIEELTERFKVRECRMQDLKNRQNSLKTADKELIEEWETLQKDIWFNAIEKYKWAIGKGIAKEQARAILPEGLTPTRFYMYGSIRSWMHYIQVRSGVETQFEHREIALECANVIKPLFPMIEQFVSESKNV